MLDTLLSFIAPHHCCGCGQTGALLCDYCKYDIMTDRSVGCIVCGGPSPAGICSTHRVPYAKAWVVAERSGPLKTMLDTMKFEFARAGAIEAGRLLAEVLPDIPRDVVVVPVPTIAPHIRERGYDHAYLIARTFARAKGLKCQQLLERRTNTKQVGATKRQRLKQAEVAFRGRHVGDQMHGTYLVIDDIVTTAATAHYAAKVLRDAGADEVWFAAVARQPLDETAKN